MNLWEFILIISIAGMIFSAWKSKHLARHGLYEDEKGGTKPIEGGGREAALQREVEELRERVKVLERIATEDRDAHRLSAEIDALRSESKIEEGSKQ